MQDKVKRNRMTSKEAYTVNLWKFVATLVDRKMLRYERLAPRFGRLSQPFMKDFFVPAHEKIIYIKYNISKGKNGPKELIDSFASTLGQESQQFSVTAEEPAQYFRDSKDPLTVRDIMEYIIFDP